MDFHFKLQRAKGGYYFDEKNELHPTTWIDENKVEEVITAEEIYKKFVEILHPFHDQVATHDYLINDYKTIFRYLDPIKDDFIPELEEGIKAKILEFANKFGMGGFFEPEYINADNTLEGFTSWEDDKDGQGYPPDLYNLIQKAVEMNEMILERKSYETVPPKLKDICNLYAMFLKPQLNGGLYMETSSIWATMYWGMAFTEYTHEVKECEYCQAPLLTDKRARFCKAPRQCKNRFNNAKRPKKKESK